MDKHDEGMPIMRFFAIMGSMAPLFIIWAIKGLNVNWLKEEYFLISMITLAAVPNIVIASRIFIAFKSGDRVEKCVTNYDNNSSHFLTYLIPMLLPFYCPNFDGVRSLVAVGFALLMIAFMFLHMNLHYMNIIFAIFGYHVYTVNPDGAKPFVLLSRRRYFKQNEKVVPYRISNHVFVMIEK